MSIFSNPISAAVEEADAYIQAVLELLADREPFEILQELEDEIRKQLTDLSHNEIHQPEAPGKWSMIEVIQHLADSELVWAYRLRTVLADTDPVFTGYDQDLWAQRLRYKEVELKDALEQLGVLRRINLRLLGRLTPEELGRHGRHTERGEESVEHMIRLYAGHDLVHRGQLARIRLQLT